MWYCKEFKGNREEIARQLNIFEDVYDDEVWDRLCEEYGIVFKED